jgi:hypothetical protein
MHKLTMASVTVNEFSCKQHKLQTCNVILIKHQQTKCNTETLKMTQYTVYKLEQIALITLPQSTRLHQNIQKVVISIELQTSS